MTNLPTLPVLAVPYVPQSGDDDCGAACLRSVLRYYGLAEQPDTLAALGDLRGGATPLELAEALADHWIQALVFPRMTLDALSCCLATGFPVLCPVALDGGHWVCVVGVDDDIVSYVDPQCGHARLTVADWLAAWHDEDRHGGRCERLGVVCYAPPRSYW